MERGAVRAHLEAVIGFMLAPTPDVKGRRDREHRPMSGPPVRQSSVVGMRINPRPPLAWEGLGTTPDLTGAIVAWPSRCAGRALARMGANPDRHWVDKNWITRENIGHVAGSNRDGTVWGARNL